MIKSLLTYIFSFSFLLIGASFIHKCILEQMNTELRFDIICLYWFFSIFSFALCVVFRILANIEKTKSQIGFLYLFTLVFKIIVFFLIFKSSIFSLPNLSKIESLNILITLFVFLILEIYFIVRLLSDNNLNSIN